MKPQSKNQTLILTKTVVINKKQVKVSDLTKGSHAIVECQCPNCGDTFKLKYHSVVERGHTKCSSCRNGGMGNNIVGMVFDRLTVIERLNGSEVRVKCSCGKTEITTAGQLISKKKKSCGCLAKEHMSEVGKKAGGSGHWNWQGGKASGRQKRSADAEHREWSTKVITRDNYICDNCKSDSGTKYAHHLDGYKDNPEKRYDLKNGVTLCKRCHLLFHAHYGQIVTKKDYVEFKKKFAADPASFQFKAKVQKDPNRKLLDWQKVRTIRKWFASKLWQTEQEFLDMAASHYGVSDEAIRMVIKNKSWKE